MMMMPIRMSTLRKEVLFLFFRLCEERENFPMGVLDGVVCSFLEGGSSIFFVNKDPDQNFGIPGQHFLGDR
jgi:hypothetical protein